MVVGALDKPSWAMVRVDAIRLARLAVVQLDEAPLAVETAVRMTADLWEVGVRP